MTPDDLKRAFGAGMLSFPVTHFTQDGALALDPFVTHVAWMVDHGAKVLFVAGGTGEGFSLTPAEVGVVTRAAKAASGGVPIVAGVGHGTAIAIETARCAQAAGADGLLVLPPYLLLASQLGLAAHYGAILNAVEIGIMLYGREQVAIHPSTLEALAGGHRNLVGYKDGIGDLATLRRITATLGDRLAYVGGMPTAELYAEGYAAAGVPAYSSAVFNFVPRFATAFNDALRTGDRDFVLRGLREVFYPFVDLRDRAPGYAVAAIKAGVRHRGFDAGPVRPPLTDITPGEHDELTRMIDAADALSGASP